MAHEPRFMPAPRPSQAIRGPGQRAPQEEYYDDDNQADYPSSTPVQAQPPFSMPLENPNSAWMPKAIVGAAFAILAGLGWYAYELAPKIDSDTPPPLVVAEATPYRMAPEQPGGMQVANQDKLVYRELVGNTQPATVASRVLPQPEEPMMQKAEAALAMGTRLDTAQAELLGQLEPAAGSEPPLRVEAGKPAAVAKSMQAQTPILPSSVEPTPKAPVVAYPTVANPVPPVQAVPAVTPEPAAAPTEAVAAAEPAVAPQPAPVEVAKTEQPEAPTLAKEEEEKEPTSENAPAVAASLGGQWRIQLASLRSEEEAARAWSTMAGKNSALLGGMSPHVERADLGAKGIYYRLQTGPFDDDSSAKRLCTKLQANGQGCFVLK